MLFKNALEKICSQKNTHKSPINPINYDQENCVGMKIIKPRHFYPLDLINANIIQSYDYWYELFKNSVAIHFSKGSKLYGSLKEGVNDSTHPRHKKVLQPNDYGKNKPAMTYIGSMNCPLAFFSTSPF